MIRDNIVKISEKNEQKKPVEILPPSTLSYPLLHNLQPY